VVSFCEHGNEPSRSIKNLAILWQAEWLSAFQRISCTIQWVLSFRSIWTLPHSYLL